MFIFEWVYGWFTKAGDENPSFFYEWSDDSLFSEWSDDGMFSEWTDRR